MLVLSRKAGERVMIGDDIEVMVAEIRGDKVRLAFKAPKELQIDRSEVRASKDAAFKPSEHEQAK